MGIMERGDPKTLVIIYLPKRRTKKKSTGPGPLLKKVWKPIADKWLKNRRVILFTNSAKAYKYKVPGVKHFARITLRRVLCAR